MAVDFTFDGVNTLTATFPSTVGQEYELFIHDVGISTPDDQIAAGTTQTLTVSDVESAHAGRHFGAWVFDWDTSRVLAGAILTEGDTAEFAQPGPISPSLTISALSYDGAGTVTVTVTDPYGYHWALSAFDYAGSPFGSTTWVGSGAAQTKTFTFTPFGGQDVVFLLEVTSNLEDPRAFLFGFADDASTTVTQGTYTWNGGVTAPTNDSCTNAIALTGLSGSFSGNNTGWAGTWPTGADPLFNYLGFGGGAPEWRKWTNPTALRLSFQAAIAPGSIGSLNAALVKGTCGSQTVDDTTCLTEFGVAASNSGGTTLDLVVDPGETVFLEIDSYTSDASEPPTAAPGDRGSFSVTWEALTVTFSDSFDGTNPTLVSDITGGALAAAEAEAVAGVANYEAHDVITAKGRIYVAWRLQWDKDLGLGGTEPHDELWVTDYLADGTDVQRRMLFDGGAILSGGGSPGATDDTRVQLFTDTSIVGAAWVRPVLVANPGRSCPNSTPSSPSTTNTDWALTHEVMIATDAASWAMIGLSGSNVITQPSVDFNGWQGFRICASTDEPGVAYLAVSYGYREVTKSEVEVDCNILHSNRFACYISAVDDLTDSFERYQINLTSGIPTTLSTDQTSIPLGSTSGTGVFPFDVTYAGTAPSAFDLANDGSGGPVIAGVMDTTVEAIGSVTVTDSLVNCHNGSHVRSFDTTITSVTRTFGANVDFQEFDTGTAIASHAYTDFRGAAGTATIAGPTSVYPYETAQAVRLFKEFSDPFTATTDRLIKTYWVGTGIQSELLNVVHADLSGTVDYIDAGNAASTVQTVIPEDFSTSDTGPTHEPFWDGIRDVWQMATASDTFARSMWRYDRLCSQVWGDPAAARDFDETTATQKGAWINLEFYYANTIGEGRKIGTIVHDDCLCAVGAAPVSGDGVIGMFEY